MRQRIEFENIEDMRRRAGIDDVELRDAINRLQVGDSVKLTLSGSGVFPGESVVLRITSIRGGEFRGKLDRVARAGRSRVPAGAVFTFTGDHIHSIPPRRRADD